MSASDGKRILQCQIIYRQCTGWRFLNLEQISQISLIFCGNISSLFLRYFIPFFYSLYNPQSSELLHCILPHHLAETPFRSSYLDRIEASIFATRQCSYRYLAQFHPHPTSTMLFAQRILALVAILISLCAPTPVIRIQNFSKQNICYKVEYSNGTGAFPNQTVCGVTGPEIGGFWIDSGDSREFNATGIDGQNFNGAITAILNNNKTIGARK